MPTTCNESSSPIDSTTADILRDLSVELEELVQVWFVDKFGVWKPYQFGPTTEGTSADTSAAAFLTAALADSLQPLKPQAVIDPQGCCWTAAMLADVDQTRWAASGQAPVAVVKRQRVCPKLACQTMRLALRDIKRRSYVTELEEAIDSFSQRVSRDFEEMNYLRHVSEQLRLADVHRDVLPSAQDVLPLLQQSIAAGGAAFIAASPLTDGSIGEVVWARDALLDDATCRRLVEIHRRQARSGPVIRNRFFQSPDGRPFPHIGNFLLVCVARDNALWAASGQAQPQDETGWLLAVNVIDPKQSQAPGFPRRSEQEFGTEEAALMTATASFLATHAFNIKLFTEKEELLVNVVKALVSAVEARDPYTCGHSVRVALYGRRLAEEMGYSQHGCERIYLTGLLHDVGKIGISDQTLKKPGRLTEQEFAEIKKHPETGQDILRDLGQLHHVLPGVVHHHERMDGKGYPHGLAGEQIPLDARILAVVDTYDALTSDRPYRQGMPQDQAETILREGAGQQWDAKVVQAFFHILPEILQIRQRAGERSPF